MTDKLYRYENLYADGTTRVELREFNVVKRTAKGYWIQLWVFSFDDKKWVSDNARKRFAYPTKKEALFNFVKRKDAQIRILKSRLKLAELASDKARLMYKEEYSEEMPAPWNPRKWGAPIDMF